MGWGVNNLTIRVAEDNGTGNPRTVVEKTVWVANHEQRVIVTGILRVLDFNAA